METSILKKIKEDKVYYTINWSKLEKTVKYQIITTVPSVPGIFELYYMDEHKHLNLFYFCKAWYGGLRNTIRKMTDPELEKDKKRKHVLDTYSCYYRYAASNSFDDMTDILFFFANTYFPKKNNCDSSNRFIDVFVEEVSDDKIVNV